MLIGWQDYKHAAVPVDAILGAKANPYNRDLARAIILLSQGKNEEVRKLMEKWTKEIGKDD